MNRLVFIFLAVFLLFCESTLGSQNVVVSSGGKYIVCRVNTVHDGHTMTVTDKTGKEHRVRLYGVGTPDRGVDFGPQSYQKLKSMVEGNVVKLSVVGKDDQNTAHVHLLYNDLDVNGTLIQSGYGWVDPSFCSHQICGNWKTHQKDAKRNHLGIWPHLNEVEPWIWFSPQNTGPINYKVETAQRYSPTTPIKKTTSSVNETKTYRINRGQTTISAYEYRPYPKSWTFIIPRKPALESGKASDKMRKFPSRKQQTQKP